MTYPGAFHHAMNRGHDGLQIFREQSDKRLFLELLKKHSTKCRISILAYCIMNTHFHLILQNNSGRMSDFFKRVNGEFGSIYRKKHGGRGYVFQDRFKTTLIQKDSYLLDGIAYVLNNPVEAGVVSDFFNYRWSSANEYYSQSVSQIVDNSFIMEAFENFDSFTGFVNRRRGKSLKEMWTKMGSVWGDQRFLEESREKFNRRTEEVSLERKRVNDQFFEPVEKMFFEFKKKHELEPENIDTTTFKGKRLRGELLVNLKDRSGMTYKEIARLDVFSDIKFSSLGRMYKNSKTRLKK